ncbi:P-loop NTPase fold protein [Mycoplasma sp. P36-A1]|uniref:P-loop NTPase fold protein n=1 Tax=Mycoplasma sp. P36-A1 TaxID=3252900 RepID=UPI003C3082D7
MSESNDDKFIVLNEINTEISAQRIAKLITEKKTYFLNGKWGSGKSVFISKVEKESKDRFIYLNLWQPSDNSTVIAKAFRKIFIEKYKNIFALFCLLVLYLFFSLKVYSKILETIESSNLENVLTIATIIISLLGLVITILKFFQFKIDDLYIYFLKNLSYNNIVLVLDDFDRVKKTDQNEAYILFNILNGRLPILFIGDYEKIIEEKPHFLSKIIDRRIELPFVLSYSNIWEKYFEVLCINFNCNITKSFINLVVSEKRNLRDRYHFNDYVNLEFFTRGKLGRVQTEQQLLIIYMYLFHPNYYERLQAILTEKKRLSTGEMAFGQVKNIDKYDELFEFIKNNTLLKNVLEDILNNRDKIYPPVYIDNFTEYLIYESTSNSTEEELEATFENELELEKKMLSSYLQDFYRFLYVKYNSFSHERKEKLLNLSLRLEKDNKSSDTINFIVREKNNEIVSSLHIDSYSEENLQNYEDIFKEWHKILLESKYDYSDSLYFFIKHGICSPNDLGKIHKDKIEDCYNNLQSLSLARPEFILVVYISSIDIWKNYDLWNAVLVKKITDLNDEQFIAFCIYLDILDNGIGYTNPYFIPENKKLTLWTKKIDFDNPKKPIQMDIIIDKLNEKFVKLESHGYKIIKKNKT